MELNELQNAWNTLATRLDRLDAQELAARQQTRRTSMRARLRGVSAWLAVQLLAGLAVVLWAGSHGFDHWGQTHLVVCAVAVHLYGIGLIGGATAQLVALQRVAYQGPVIEVQAQLEQVRRARVLQERVLLLAGCALWVPVGLLLLHGLGVDVWLRSPGAVWANLGVAMAMAAGLAVWMHRCPVAFERDAVGAELQAASEEVDDR